MIATGEHPRLPARVSHHPDGSIKNTPANRALRPVSTPATVFAALAGEAFYADDRTVIFNADVQNAAKFLIKEGVQVDCIVTSPPFYGQRDYGTEGQIGLEDRPQDFIKVLVEIFDMCRALLKDTGSLWVNLGDTYWSGKGAAHGYDAKQGARRFGLRPQDKPGDGVWARPKQLLLIPHRFAIAMQDAGWLVRNDNVWVKPNPIPDQVRDRCSSSHEYVFHFTKERWYYFDRTPVGRQTGNGGILPPLDTWQVPPSRGNGTHRSAFSEELVRVPILATTPAGGVVLDPFSGSGTTMRVAKTHGFRSIGIDSHHGYCTEAAARLDGAR